MIPPSNLGSPVGWQVGSLAGWRFPRRAIAAPCERRKKRKWSYGWMPHKASFDFLNPTPSILLLRQFWD
jgi:hypothetical protein